MSSNEVTVVLNAKEIPTRVPNERQSLPVLRQEPAFEVIGYKHRQSPLTAAT
jgi:hypothetical protein